MIKLAGNSTISNSLLQSTSKILVCFQLTSSYTFGQKIHINMQNVSLFYRLTCSSAHGKAIYTIFKCMFMCITSH